MDHLVHLDSQAHLVPTEHLVLLAHPERSVHLDLLAQKVSRVKWDHPEGRELMEGLVKPELQVVLELSATRD